MTEGDAGEASNTEVAAPPVPQIPDSPVIETPSPDPGEIAVPASNGAGTFQQPTTPTPEPQMPTPETPVLEPTQVAGEPAVPQAPPAIAAPAPIIPSQSILAKGLEKIRFRKRAKLEKIIALAHKKESITNNDVQKLAGVSDATASRYLAQLVQEGKLRRVGPQKQPRYEPAACSNRTI